MAKYTLVFTFKFTKPITITQKKELIFAINKLRNGETEINIEVLKGKTLRGTLIKPEYNKIGKSPNARNSFALIKKVKTIVDVESTKINIKQEG